MGRSEYERGKAGERGGSRESQFALIPLSEHTRFHSEPIPHKMEDITIMKTRFNEEMYKLKLAKGKNTQLLTLDQYFTLLNKVQVAKDKIARKTPEDYQRLSRYDIVTVGTVKRLIVPVKNETEPIQYYCFLEETFDIIHLTHISIGHGGRNKMMKELKQKYKNITKEFVVLYLSLCEPCQRKLNVHSLNNEKLSVNSLNNDKFSDNSLNNEKLSVPKKEVKPMQSDQLNSRCQVNLVDMRSQPDGEFNFIMVYQDYHTKFLILRPLKSEQAEEVAYHLLDIFTIFGPPCVLYSDNGEEFANKVIDELSKQWNELNIVYDPNQSQGSENQDVEKMLLTWMETGKTTKWSEGLRFIQFMKNRAYRSGIGCSPFEAMFGCKAQEGLKTMLTACKPEIASEEDMETILVDGNFGE